MEVSTVTTQTSSMVSSVAALTALAESRPNVSSETPSHSSAHDAGQRHVDPSEGVAERASSGIDRLPVVAPSPPRESNQLWIPAWVRATYASRARHGWFLPAP